MFCITVACMKITSTSIYKGWVWDIPHSWLDHSHILIKIIWIVMYKAFILTYADIKPQKNLAHVWNLVLVCKTKEGIQSLHLLQHILHYVPPRHIRKAEMCITSLLCRARCTIKETRWTHPHHEIVFTPEHALKEHIVGAESCSIPLHKLSTNSLSHHSMQLVVVIEPTTYPSGSFDHCFVVRKLSNWLQRQIDGMSKARLPHNLILLTHQYACLFIIWSVVSYDLNYMFLA
jgi:hypothetical protein